MGGIARQVARRALGALAIALAATPGAAQQMPWQQACAAIRPTVACTAENRVAIEEAMAQCRRAGDQPACQRAYLTRPQGPAPPPTIFRGGR